MRWFLRKFEDIWKLNIGEKIWIVFVLLYKVYVSCLNEFYFQSTISLA